MASSFWSQINFLRHPVLGQGVLCLGGALGVSSSGGGLDPSFWGLVVGHGTSANCPISNLYTVTSMDVTVDLVTGVWVEAVATVGAGVVEFTGVVVIGVEDVGWLSTLTLYLLWESQSFSFCQGHLPWVLGLS